MGLLGPQAPILGTLESACATILGCVRYYFACTTLVHTLIYCNLLKEVRLGGWGTEEP